MNFLDLVSMVADKGVSFKDKQLAFKCQIHCLLTSISWADYSTIISLSEDADNSTSYIIGLI